MIDETKVVIKYSYTTGSRPLMTQRKDPSFLLWKTFWEKEKILLSRIFSFSQSVFYILKKKKIFETILVLLYKGFYHRRVKYFIVWLRVNSCVVKSLTLVWLTLYLICQF